MHRGVVTSRVVALDGLRACAVLAVILYHAVPGAVPGGFLGVDIFFVLSGYLITGLLLTDIMRSGRIHLGGFWLRRARRLLPALFLMLIVVSAALLLLPADLRVNLGKQVLGAVTYSSNWVYIAMGNDYFDRGDRVVLSHLWSLAIEEQYYLVWPVVVLALVWLRRRMGSSRWSVIVIALMALASAVWMGMLFESGTDVSRIYYGTDTHASGLLIGSALAFVMPLGRERPAWGRGPGSGLVGMLGFALLIVLVLSLGDQSAAAYQGGIFAACLAVALVLAVISDPATAMARILSHRWLVWVGRRSYGMYLWHWPIIVVLATLLPPAFRAPWVQAVIVFVVLVVSGAIAAVSYRYVEEPIRRVGFAQWLASWGTWRRPARRIVSVVCVAVLTCSFVAVTTAPQTTTLERDLQQQQRFAQGSPTSIPPSSPPASSVSPEPESSSVAAASPSPSASTARQVTGAQIAAVGDSVMLAAADELTASFPGILIDAQVSRQGAEVCDLVAQLGADDPQRSLFIIGAGTNGPLDADELSSVIDGLGPDREVILVNVFADRSWAAQSNDVLTRVAAAHSNVVIANWQDAASAHPEDLYSDGIHPRPGEGARLYVSAIRAALGELGYSS